MSCEECPKLVDCDKESMKDLEIMKDLWKGINNGFTSMAYEAADKLQRRLEERHLKITGRA